MKFRIAALGAAAILVAFPALAAPAIEKSVKVPPGGLYEIVFNSADKSVYVAAVGPRGSKEPKIVVVDGGTLAVKREIDLGGNGLYGLGLNNKTQVLYGTATRTGTLAALDLKSGKIVEIKDGEDAAHVREALVDEQNNKVYVTIVGGVGDKAASNPNQLWVVDGATNKIERKITVPTGSLTGGALDIPGKRVFVTGMGAEEVVAVNLTNDEVIGRWKAGSKPTNVAYDAVAKRLYVANQGSGDLTVLDSSTGAHIATVKTGDGALSVAVNPKVGQVYVGNRQAGTLTVVDTKTNAVIANLNSGTLPQTIAIDPATNRVYVSNKAKGLPRNAPAGTPTPEDPTGDTLTVIKP